MTKHAILLATALVLIVPRVAAQDEAPPLSIAVSYFQCDYSGINDWMNQIDSLALPIHQELVNEGKERGYGTLIHNWAGYDNVIIWRSGDSIASILEAQDEFGRRMNERHPDAPAVGCGRHHDAFYRLGPNTGPPRKGFDTEVVSYYKCRTGDLNGITRRADSTWIPIMNEFVEEGRLGSFGLLVHDWASEENLLLYATAKDIPSWLEIWQEWGDRMNERYPDANVMGDCNAHRDGFYGVGPRTYGPTE